MKTSFGYLLLALGLASASHAGDFVNLDFNSPALSHAVNDAKYGLLVPPQDALRGWSLQWDWSGPPLALPSFVGTTGGWAPFGLCPGLDTYFGAYRLQVHDYWYPPNAGSLRPTFHLYQVGVVPPGATQLDYWLINPPLSPPDPDMRIYINGVDQNVAWDAQSVDVSRFAGQEVKLEFVFPGGRPLYYFSFDIYGFVPEPSVWALFGVGGVVFLYARKRR